MQPDKLQFSQDVLHAIKEICKLVFNAETDAELENLFGMRSSQIEKVIQQLVAAFPEMLFLGLPKQRREEMKNICAQEFIFFQVQERWSDTDYQENLDSFIALCCRDMVKRFE